MRLIAHYTHPSADAVQGWIPCSERLPNAREDVLACTEGGLIIIAHYTKGGVWYSYERENVVAWIPLYKGGDDE